MVGGLTSSALSLKLSNHGWDQYTDGWPSSGRLQSMENQVFLKSKTSGSMAEMVVCWSQIRDCKGKEKKDEIESISVVN